LDNACDGGLLIRKHQWTFASKGWGDMTKTTGLKVRAAVKAGGMNFQHNRQALKVRAGVRSGGLTYQHNRRALKVRAGVRSGGFSFQHNRRSLLLNARRG
jgi:hypothetical protein